MKFLAVNIGIPTNDMPTILLCTIMIDNGIA